MRKFERTKKLLSVLLAVVMVLSYVPVRAMAEECSHHSHDENCGYKEAVEGSACTHQHTESCTEEVTVCIHVHSEEAGCVLTPAAEAVACDHDCANGDCSYVAAQEAVPCTCGAQPQHDAACASVITEGEECNCTTTLTHGEGCEPKEAVAEVACDHTHGSCAYREAVAESWSCDHICAKDNGCITVKENCSHVCPADDCGFVEAVEASPCTFVCEECLNEDVCPECESTGGAHSENCPKAVCPFCGNLNEAHSETCSTRCTSAEGCIDGQHGKDCPLYICGECNQNPCICAVPKLADTDDGCGIDGAHLFATNWDGSEHFHSMDIEPNRGIGVYLHFRDENGTDTEVSYDENVTFTGVVKAYNNSGSTSIGVSGFGEGAIVYKPGDVSYSFPIYGVLPDYAVFAEAERTVEKYTETVFANAGEEATIYLMWDSDCDKPASIIGEVESYGSENYIEVFNTEIFDTYAKITFTVPDTNMIFISAYSEENSQLGACRLFRNNSSGGGSGSGSGGTGGHTCAKTEPHLYIMHENGHDSWDELNMVCGTKMPAYVWFRNAEGVNQSLSFDDLTFTGAIKPYFTGPGGLEIVGAGHGTIEYTVGGNTYILEVNGTMPEFAAFSAADRAPGNLIKSITGRTGDEKKAYLMWDKSQFSNPGSVVVKDNVSKETIVELTLNNPAILEAGYVEINFALPESNWIGFYLMSSDNTELASWEVEKRNGGSGSQNQRTVTVEINNTPVTVGIAAAMGPEGDLMDLNTGGGANVTHDPNYPDTGLYLKLCVGAMVNFGDPEAEAVANQGIYNQILDNASITVKEWQNFDGTDSTEPNIKMATPYEGTVSGVETLVTVVTADPLKLGMCQLELTFTYDEQTYKTYYNITYENTDMSVNVSEDTDLAEVLSSSDNLIEWLEDNHLDALRAYGGDGFVNINLPAKVYDDPIVVNIDEPAFRKIRIRGSTGGSGRTVMRNLTIKQGVFAVDDIDFVAGNSGNQVAIIHDNDAENYHSTLGSVSGCTFQGYPVGVKDIGHGHIRYISDSLFYNCGTSVIIHPETTGAGDNGGTIEYHRNTFMNTDVAISLEALPVGISAYRTQFNDNTFLFCDLEFNMVPTGTFYFLRNYYGGKERGNEKYEDWKHPGNKADEKIRHHARIQEADKSGTKTVTNPVRKTIDTPCEYWIYTGEDQHTAIFNAESARMLIDGATFEDPVAAASSEGADDKDIPVSILDNNGDEIAKWTF